MTVVGQCLHDCLVERGGLLGPQQLPHRKDVSERRLLQLAEYGVTAIDRRSHLRSIAVLGFHRLCKTRIVRPQLKLERTSLDRKLLFQRLKPCLLPGIERQFMMKHFV